MEGGGGRGGGGGRACLEYSLPTAALEPSVLMCACTLRANAELTANAAAQRCKQATLASKHPRAACHAPGCSSAERRTNSAKRSPSAVPMRLRLERAMSPQRVQPCTNPKPMVRVRKHARTRLHIQARAHVLGWGRPDLPAFPGDPVAAFEHRHDAARPASKRTSKQTNKQTSEWVRHAATRKRSTAAAADAQRTAAPTDGVADGGLGPAGLSLRHWSIRTGRGSACLRWRRAAL